MLKKYHVSIVREEEKKMAEKQFVIILVALRNMPLYVVLIFKHIVYYFDYKIEAWWL